MAEQSSTIRLNKFIAQQLSIGRRQADTFIEAGRVTVNGKVPILGAQIDPHTDVVEVDKQKLEFKNNAFSYVLLNKPVGYVCSRRQQGDAPTIYSLLPEKYQHLKPVGRLDKDSSGLLLLTNNGDLAHRLTHPGFEKTKIYQATIDKPLEPLHQQMISDFGVDLPDGKSKFILQRLKKDSSTAWQITMHEGRNRQIRRTFAALGYTVTALHRTNFGNFTDDVLAGKPFIEVEL